MISFATSGLGQHGHREIRFLFSEPVPVPHLERLLLGYFENAVASGVKFEPGQRIDLGGSLLRMFDRGDGTLGVRDVGSDGEDIAPESVHRALMRTWCRQEVARSWELTPSFPSPHHRAIVCSQLEASKHAVLLKHLEPTSPDDSGWYIGCTDPNHSHDSEDNLGVVYLLQIGDRYPWLDQFFALPVGTDLIVEMNQRVSVPALWRGEGEPIAPKPGSYVAALNQA
jgi:hypothetical protein